MQLRKLTYFGRMTAGIASWLRLALLLLCVSVSGVLLADRWVNTQYNTTEGNEFYITAMKNAGASEGDNANLKVYLYATSRLKTQIRVVSNDGKFDKKITIPEGGQQGLDIPLEYVYADCASNIDASVSVAEMFDVTENQNKSLHVYACDDSGRQDTTKRFSLYITNLHKKAGYEATNVLPIEALERAYMVQTYHDDVEGTEFAIVATENNQIFELKLKLAEYDTTDGLDTVISKTITIAKKGQVRVVGVTNADYSLSGTTICSNAKFVLVNGNQLAQIPNGVSNHTFEQSISADKWGREYVVTPTSEHSTDYVLLTALEDNTVVKKDGAVLTTMNSGETYTDILTNNGSIAPYYTSNKNILCYLYKTTKANNGNSIRPTMTSISPMNAGLHSIIIAAFNATATDLNLKPKEFVEIKNHFINIVTEAKYKDEIYIDKEKITGFKPVPANNNFYYCIYKIPNTGSDPAYKKPHVLSCKNPQGTFTVRMYGHEGDFSYAYNAGFRVNRKVDMLINDQYLDTLEICKEEDVKLTSIIGFDYESIDWCIKSRDAGNREQFTDSIIKYNFTTDSTKTTIYDVQLAVTSKMPDICDECQSCDPMYLRDMVSAIVIVKNSVNEYVSQNVCLNDAFSATAYGGTKVYNYIADTTIWQPQPYKNEKVKLKVNTIFEVRDTLRRTNGCDSIIVQRFIVRLPDTTSLDTSICDNQLPFVWKYNEGRNSMTIDTIKGKELVIKREVAYNNKYGCPSMATLNLHVYPTHKKVDNVVICQEPKGNKYKWNGHEGHIVYDVKNKKRINANDIPADVQGTYTYIDSLKTGCNDCPKCDSIVELNLTILDNIVVPIYDTICDNELPYNYPGIDKFQNLTQSGEYRETFTSKLSGCDSVVVLYLQVNNRTTYDTTIYHCENHLPFIDPHTQLKYYSSTKYFDTITNVAGCDSIIRVNFVVTDTFHTHIDTVICENYSPYNHPDSRAIHLRGLTQSGVYYDTIPTHQYGCDSILILNLKINPVTIHKQNVVWCRSAGPYSFPHSELTRLHNLTVSGVYRDTLISVQNQYGCDSIVEITLDILESIVVPIYDTICDNELPYSYPGIDKFQNLTQSGEYRETFTSKLSGCDSVVVLYLQVNNRTTYDTTIYHCENHLPFIDPHTQLKYYSSTKYFDTITNVAGCDSIIRVNFVVTDTFHTHIDTVICENYSPYNHPDSRAIHLRGLTQSGVYYDTIPTHQYGCDSILILNLTINPLTTCYKSVTWCLSSGPYNFPENPGYPLPNLQGLTESKTYRDTLYGANQYGCDSIIELDLTILETIVTPLYDSICDNELPYNHPSMDKFRNLTHTGEYSDTLTSKLTGCDSIVVLHLQVNKTYNTTDTITICASEGSPYIWRPSDVRGPQEEIAIPFEIDDRVNVKDKQTLVLNDSSVLLQSVHGCDSLVNLCLIVHPTYELVEVDTVDCQDTIDRYSTWTDQLGGVHQIDISEAGWITIAENPGTIYGCDSIIGIKLYVRPTYRYDSVYTICQDERITWQGKTYAGSHYGYNYQMLSDGKYAEHRDSVYYLYEPGDFILEAGVHHDTIVYPTILGCDSTFYLTLNVLPTSNTILDVSICDNMGEYVFETRDKDSTYYDTIPIFPITEMIDSVRKDTAFYMRQRTLKTPDGCDSTVYLHLTVTPTYEYITRAEICATDVYTWRGRDYNKAGVYYNEYRTEQDCDSNYILELAVRPVMFISRTLHACDNQTVMHSDTLWYDPDSIRFAIDSTLLWKPGMQIPDTNECREVHYYTTDGRCDSIIYKYYLHIHPTYDSIANDTICSNESYQLHDSFIYTPAVAYHEPGSNPAVIDTLIADTLRTLTCMECEGGGCDSVFRANIRILPAYKHIDSVTICSDDTCFWREKKYNEPIAGLYVYYDSLSTINNCDSIYELHLTVHQAYDHDVFDTICSDEYYHFGDTLLNQTGEYLDTLRTIHDCDSIVHLFLTVLDTTVVITYDTICVTEKYRFFDAIYTEPGSYDTITLNDWGCKQYNYLHLAVIDTTAYNISIGDVLCADDEELWVEYEWISGRRLIEYSVFFDEFGHSQGFEDIIHAPLDPTLSYFAIPIPRGEDLPMPPHAYFDSQQGVNSFINETKQNYPEPNRYTMRVVMHNGICGDSLQRKDTTISFWYPSWIHEQHWNDVIVLYRDTFNGGYQFSNYQWYQNGQPLPGATGEYLYLPEQLLMNQRGDCSNYYQVELTRLSDGYTTMTCPICPVLMKDTIVPQDTYFSVVPTLVPKANPVIHFLASHAGTYTITTLMGNTIVSGEFVPDANNYAGNVDLRDYISATNTILNVKLTLNTGETRTIKVMIGN